MISTEYILLHWNELKDSLGQLVCLQEVNLQRWQEVNFQPLVSTPSTIWVNSLLCRSYLFNAWIWNRPLTHFQNVILHSLIFLSEKFSFQESQPLRNSTPCVPAIGIKINIKKREKDAYKKIIRASLMLQIPYQQRRMQQSLLQVPKWRWQSKIPWTRRKWRGTIIKNHQPVLKKQI